MTFFDPYVGYTPAANRPSYFNPYTNRSGAQPGGPQTQPGQQAGQAFVPGKDTKSPQAGGKVRLRTPKGSMIEVPHTQVAFLLSKGARRF